MTTLTYAVPGISCDHCVAAVTAEVSQVSGVATVTVDLGRKTVTVTGDALVDEEIRGAIAQAGYEVA
ncbi:MAG: heavy-metal-associated domain-containing protein [Actinobacteria bacterium]|nr:heavy-metal-associated domain-containing protein [Actinomycetota bacterium]